MNELATRTPAELELPASGRKLVEASVSENTRRAYTGALAQLDAWLSTPSLEVDDAGVATYLSYLFEAGRAPASAAMVVAALRFRAKLAGKSSPIGPLSERILAGFRRQSIGRGQVTGVGWAQSDALAALAARRGLAGLRRRCPDRGGL